MLVRTRRLLFRISLIASFVGVATPSSIAAITISDSDIETCRQSTADAVESITACTRIIESDPKGPSAVETYNNRGIAKIRAGDLHGSIADFTNALDRNPRNTDALRNRGLAFQMMGDYDQAIANFNQALRVDRNSAQLLNARGSALLSKNEYERAIADFNAALSLDKRFAKAYINRGLAFVYTRKLDKAIDDFDQAIRISPNDSIGYINRASALLDKSRFEAAISDYNVAIKLSPKSWVGYSRRGEAWRLKGEIDRSIEDHNQAIQLDGNAEAYNNRALALKQKGELDAAIADCDEAIVLDPRFVFAYVNRGQLWRLKGQLDRSLTDLNKAVGLDPKSAIALTFRGDTWREFGELDRSLADFNEALRIVPDFVAAYTGRGSTFEKKGNFSAAKADFEKSLQLPAETDVALAKPAQQLAKLRLGIVAQALLRQPAPVIASSEGRRIASAAQKAEDERALADAVTKAKVEAEKQAKAEYESRLKIEVDAKEKQLAAKATAEAEAKLVAAAEAVRLRLAAEAHARAATESRERAEVEARLRAEIEAKFKAEYAAKVPEQKIPDVADAAEQGVRVALVIGNSAYRDVALLPNPKRDAERIAEAFRKIGFQTVISVSDVDRVQFLAALRTFEQQVAKADWAVVYYAGHGLEIGGVNYLVPVDAKLKSDRDVSDESIPLERVLLATEGAKALRLAILDACRDNPFVSRMQRTMATRSIGRGLARIEPEGGTLVAYSAKEGEVARDGDGDSSPFAQAFLRRLIEPRLEINMLFRQVRDDVLQQTGRRQEPFTYGSLPGQNFYFVSR